MTEKKQQDGQTSDGQNVGIRPNFAPQSLIPEKTGKKRLFPIIEGVENGIDCEGKTVRKVL